MKILDLFSGIGGFSLGLYRAGMQTVAFCEIEPFCRAVLANHWPGVPIYEDVRAVTGARLAADGIVPDLICGGFPCQDISVAGRGAGLDAERSGLWFEYLRIIEEVAPRWVVIENVPALRSRGLDRVLGGLAAVGYDAEWHCIPASAVGAPHRRDRVWIVAHRDRRQRDGTGGAVCAGWDAADGDGGDVAHATDGGRRVNWHERGQACDAGAGQPAYGGADVADASRQGLPSPEQPEWREPVISAADIRRAATERGWGRAAPGMGGEADGVPAGVDGTRPVEAWEGNTPRTIGRGYPNRRPRLKALGNSVVPQIPELIGRAIMRAEAGHAA